MTSTKYVCAQCGTTHEGYLTDRGWKMPDDAWALPEAERAARSHCDADLCKLDDRYFIRCILRVPFTERVGYFGWGVWAEVALTDFERWKRTH